ncbi:GMC oxidoreductase [Thermomonospora cellulosilytica]|uniref:Cholesterol oxidase n=1 Tax=Thermomonospora cellulosilytica TaxID=1411118 RepID=A0A7W3MZM5_9ACTN|nr:GMC oxidoreductase [Thermomonospora cellulosilytica]MBA9004826.1 cholesterol oxidase [Thermomonospora cellulosilytica]
MSTALTRRQFVGLSAGGALAALTAATIGAPGGRAYARETARRDYQAIVIGSGFGGSVAALRLGQAGVDTLVLERGREWPIPNDTEQVIGNQAAPSNKMFWMRPDADYPGVPAVTFPPAPGVMEVSNESNLDIACGAAVGGGSIVYTGVTVAPPRRHFERIYKDLSYDEFAQKWYPLVRRMLGASPMPQDIHASSPFTHSRVWETHLTRSGYAPAPLDSTFDWDVIRREMAGQVRASAIIGESDFGNSNGAKKSLTRNYLPAALATGRVRLQPLTEVVSLGRAPGGGYAVNVRRLGEDGSVVAEETFTCRQLFVCAGTLNTNRLLVAARDRGDLPQLPDEVGAGFGDNGDQYNLYVYRDGSPVGTSQGSPCASGVFVEDEFDVPMRAENWYLFGARNAPVCHSFTMTVDLDNRGRFTYDRASGQVRLSNWTPDKAEPSRAAAAKLTEKILDSNPGLSPYPLSAPITMTAHPLGGVVLGEATDLYGRVKGNPGLYVLDGSLLPGTVGGGNPSLSIAALAERCIAAIISAGR